MLRADFYRGSTMEKRIVPQGNSDFLQRQLETLLYKRVRIELFTNYGETPGYRLV
jgi:hypothetical protein